MAPRNLDDLTVGPADPIRVAMQRIDRNRCGIALVVDEQRRLLSTVTDGDIRRAILGGIGIDLPLSQLLERRGPRRAISAVTGATHTELLATMRASTIQQIPILDEQRRVVDLVLMADLVPQKGAGGSTGIGGTGGNKPDSGRRPLLSLTE